MILPLDMVDGPASQEMYDRIIEVINKLENCEPTEPNRTNQAALLVTSVTSEEQNPARKGGVFVCLCSGKIFENLYAYVSCVVRTTTKSILCDNRA